MSAPARLRSTPTRQLCLPSIGPEFGARPTSAPSAPLTSPPMTGSLGASLARTSAPPEKARASQAPSPGSGGNSDDSSASADPAGALLRTSLISALEARTGCSLTWKHSATPDGRTWWVLQTLARPTDVSGSGLSLPTPTAQQYGYNKGGAAGRTGQARESLTSMARHGTFPTPLAADAQCATKNGFRGNPSLYGMAKDNLWPAPRASANENRQTTTPSQRAGTHGMSLGAAVNAWPTPLAGNARSGKVLEATRDKNSRPLQEAAATEASGFLNPTWVEWLMGFPPNWTALSGSADSVALATESSRRMHESSAKRSARSRRKATSNLNKE